MDIKLPKNKSFGLTFGTLFLIAFLYFFIKQDYFMFNITLLTISIIFYFLGFINIPKVPIFDFKQNLFEIINRSQFTATGDASYPEWSKYKDNMDILYKTPVRMLLFYVSPLPWDIKKLSHIIIMFDGFFYFFLIYLLIKNFKYIWSNYTLRILLIILLFYSLIFALGIGNFGTGFRHRAKFLTLLILIVAAYLPKISLSRKIDNK